MHLFYEMGKVFPEAYQPVVDLIPDEERNDLFSAYYRRIFEEGLDVQLHAARTFMRYDMACATHLPNPAAVEKVIQDDRLVLSITKAFFHYAKHDFFIEPNQILLRMQRISHLPAIIVHGRWDAIDLPVMAFSLYQSWKNSTLWMVTEGGHSAFDPAISTALAHATDLFAEQLK